MRQLEESLKPPPDGRVFRIIVEEDEATARIASFQATNGLTDDDLLIVRTLSPATILSKTMHEHR